MRGGGHHSRGGYQNSRDSKAPYNNHRGFRGDGRSELQGQEGGTFHSPGAPIQFTENPQGPPGCNLFIFHIPNEFTNLRLYELFKPWGNVISARIMIENGTGRSRGFGFVSFDSEYKAWLGGHAFHACLCLPTRTLLRVSLTILLLFSLDSLLRPRGARYFVVLLLP